ncbi:MAG: acetylglutamate kinase, partial [Bacteroidota bacterium]|nr:acetylglutamate kinase [Bacteroidota bacterium]
MKENMYYGASHLIFQKAEELRNRMTPAEEILWKHIHINQWKLKFRRQHPIWNYVADFYCHGIKLVIELDGSVHEAEDVKKNDEAREKHLKELGLTVLRFKNKEVFKNITFVLKTISKTIETLQNTPLVGGGKSILYIIKIGGNIIDDEKKLSSFLKDFSGFEGKKILVHGGGKLATKMAEQMNIPQQVIDGRRITDAETLKIVTMVYAGYINKNIVAKLQMNNCNAIGLCGADGDAILAHKRNHPVMDYGYVGDVDAINTDLISSLLEKNLTPVFAPITHDQQGQLLNTNADTIAQELAKGLSNQYEVTLIYSFEKSGVLLDVNDESSVIPKLNWEEYQILKKPSSPSGDGGKIFAGMIPKLDNAFTALDNGV